MRASSRLTDVSCPLAHAPAGEATVTYFKFSVLVTRHSSTIVSTHYTAAAASPEAARNPLSTGIH